jgi:hypothetical protein
MKKPPREDAIWQAHDRRRRKAQRAANSVRPSGFKKPAVKEVAASESQGESATSRPALVPLSDAAIKRVKAVIEFAASEYKRVGYVQRDDEASAVGAVDPHDGVTHV